MLETTRDSTEQGTLQQAAGRGIDVAADETTLLRIGLVCAGALCFWTTVQVATSAPLAEMPIYLLAVIALGALGLAAMAAAGLRTPPRQLPWLILLVVILEIVLTAGIWRQTQSLHPFSRVDVALYIDMASELVQRGENPYTWDLNGVLEIHRAAQAASTPHLDGSITGQFDYPALSVLAVLPFDLLGLPGTWLIPILAQIGMVILIFFAAPPGLRPIALFPFVVWFSFSDLTAVGANDIVWSALIVAMIVSWRHPNLRAIFYGLAIAYKQVPWFLFPFLVVRIWCESDPGTKTLKRLAGVATFTIVGGLTFLLVNLPFLAWDPKAWFEGVFAPMSENLVYLSQGGLSGLTAFGYTNLPKGYYLLAMLMILGLLLFAYRRHYALLRDTFVIMPAIVTWFSYRSLVAYWVYWLPPALALLLCRPPPASTPARGPSWVRTALICVASVVILGAAGVLLASELPLAVEPVPPYLTRDGQVNRLVVRVENESDRTLRPRFGIQYDYTGFNPLPWHIESGPLLLKAGEAALYRISGDGLLPFVASSATQLVVTDAGGDYGLRGMASIGPDPTYLWPDAIPNPEFLYWDSDATAPILWGRRVQPDGAGTVSYAHKDGRHTVQLALIGENQGPRAVAVNSFLLMPRQPFGLWVYADMPPDSQSRYGIEFSNDERRLTLRFGQRDKIQFLSDTHVLVERAVPVGEWTYQGIDLVDLYRQVGWDPPPLRSSVYRGVKADFRTVDMALFLSSDGEPQAARVHFGPLEQASFEIKPEILMDETLSAPVGYYLRLSDQYVAERNYARALLALERAQQIAPGDQEIAARKAEIEAILPAGNGP